MKFYSEKTKTFYDSEKECRKAEIKFDLEKQAADKERHEKEQQAIEAQNAISKEKKELALVIEQADAKLNQAYQAYDLAKENVEKIYTEAKKEAEELLIPAKEAIQVAQKERFEAISNFNKKFGAYTTTYSGDRAYQELLRTSRLFDNFFKLF